MIEEVSMEKINLATAVALFAWVGLATWCCYLAVILLSDDDDVS